ncbi:MAG: hypoxanthine phosphoribosyltransferase [Phocaeicola sp.]
MNPIQIRDKHFTPFISEEKIQMEVARVASEINRDLAGQEPLLISVLNGAFMFTADLMRNLTVPHEVSFVKVASYEGTESTGKIKEMIGLNESIEGRSVIIVEDIVDTGFTMNYLVNTLKALNPKEIRIATLLFKPEKLQVELNIDYVAMSIPNDFIVGYGLDYDGQGRNYRDIYVVAD